MRAMAMQGLELHCPEHCLGLAKSGERRAALAEADHARTPLTGAPSDGVPFWALAGLGPPAASVYSRSVKVHGMETTGQPPSTI